MTIRKIKLWLSDDISAGGRLDIELDSGTVLSLDVKGRHARLLRAMCEALRDDAGSPHPNSGFRSLAQLAERYYDAHEKAGPPDKRSVRAYLTQIRQLLRARGFRGGEEMRLWETRRSVGVKLVAPLEIILPSRPKA